LKSEPRREGTKELCKTACQTFYELYEIALHTKRVLSIGVKMGNIKTDQSTAPLELKRILKKLITQKEGKRLGKYNTGF